MKQNNEIPLGWKLPDEITRRLGVRTGKQRVIAETGHILVVLHKVPKKNDSHSNSLFLWRNQAGKWEASERGNGLSALDEYLESFSKVEDKLDEDYEKAVNAKDFFNLLERLAPLQRALKNTSKTLQDARQIVGEEFINYRDSSEELYRNIELLYTDSKNGLDYAIAKKAEEQSEMQRQALIAGHRLNVLMALFLPITAVASLLGMNIPHGLEKSSTQVFVTIVIVSTLLGLIIRSWVLRKHVPPPSPEDSNKKSKKT